MVSLTITGKHVAAVVKFNVFTSCWDYGESREGAVRMGREWSARQYAVDQGAHPVELQLCTLEFALNLSVIGYQVSSTTQAQCTIASPAEMQRLNIFPELRLINICRSPKIA